MCALALNNETLIVRPVAETDTQRILRLLEESWRVHLRMAWSNLKQKVQASTGVLVEDRVGLRGFMLIEPQSPQVALISAASLRDTWGVRPYLDTLLPQLEQIALAHNLSALVYLGYEDWLIKSLPNFGFAPREWIITLERAGERPLPGASSPAMLRSAHRSDLAALLALDTIAFDGLWRKSVSYFNEALAHAGSFMVAEFEGEIVGYEWCEIHYQQAHLTRLAVHPRCQGLGIGAQLLYQAITEVLAQGINLITLNTQETNYRSQALYTRFGFTPTRQRVPVLWKDLTP